jgi:hypothetical protein
MENLKALTNTCKANSAMINHVVEEFLLKNVVNHKKLAPEINTRFAHYQHITTAFQDGWNNMLQMQYLVHAILKKEGLIKNYLHHSALQQLAQNEQNFLHQLASHPWKFSFSIIVRRPALHFFEMEDVFTGESFLLYSPGVADILKDRTIMLWFNLIGYNGTCWQSYGPIAAYNSFIADDIFFFATKLHPNKWLETGHNLMDDVETNPVPYMMLLSGSAYPITLHKNDIITQVTAEYDIDFFNTKALNKDFKIEYNNNVYKLALKRWNNHPHFSSAFYDEKKKTLLLYALTDRGFSALIDRLNGFGFNLSPEPDIRVGMSMTITAEKILKKKIVLNNYESLFIKDQPKENKEGIDGLNNLLEMALPEINAGKAPNIKLLAKKAGVDEEMARAILKQVIDKLDNMKNHK